MPFEPAKLFQPFSGEAVTATRQWASLAFHAVIAAGIIGVLIYLATYMSKIRSPPPPPPGPSGRDFNGLALTRKKIQDFATSKNPAIDLTKTPMRSLQVTTASYGGIFTERGDPYIGTVDPTALKLQIEGGARAVILDIWPDPENHRIPVVCAMMDVTQRRALNWWANRGLDKGLGKYSNWQLATRNKVPAKTMFDNAIQTAFGAVGGSGAIHPQDGDPFFLILRLHGAMTIDYLNTLGQQLLDAIGPHRMPSEWNRNANAAALATEPITTFLDKCFVIVSPDIQTGYNILPNVNTYEKFTEKFLGTSGLGASATTLGEATNLLEQAPNTIFFTPNNSGAATPLTSKGFCVLQDSIGGTSTETPYSNFQNYFGNGIQFVGFNMFDDKSINFFTDSHFNIYSFKQAS
jgi:hypothetical protein